jgi:hypothetical protein
VIEKVELVTREEVDGRYLYDEVTASACRGPRPRADQQLRHTRAAAEPTAHEVRQISTGLQERTEAARTFTPPASEDELAARRLPEAASRQPSGSGRT